MATRPFPTTCTGMALRGFWAATNSRVLLDADVALSSLPTRASQDVAGQLVDHGRTTLAPSPGNPYRRVLAAHTLLRRHRSSCTLRCDESVVCWNAACLSWTRQVDRHVSPTPSEGC